jgi:hypothetical protein
MAASMIWMGQQVPAPRKLRERAQHTHKILFRAAEHRGERTRPNTGLHRIDQAERTVVARLYLGVCATVANVRLVVPAVKRQAK